MLIPFASATETVAVKPYAQLISTHFTSKDGLPAGPIGRGWFDRGKLYAKSDPSMARPGRAGQSDTIYQNHGKRWAPEGSMHDGPPRLDAVIAIQLKSPVQSWAQTRGGALWAVTEKGPFKKEKDN